VSPTIRQATEADLAAMQDIAHRTIRFSYTPFLGEEAVESYLASGASDDYLQKHNRCSTLIEVDGQIAGFSTHHDNQIDLMMIDHGKHRRGVGSALLHYLEEALFAEHSTLRLESFESNIQANSFYRKHGWTEIDRVMDDEVGIKKYIFTKHRPKA